MEHIQNAIKNLNKSMSEKSKVYTLSFDEFLDAVEKDPYHAIRNVFQVFHDLVLSHVMKKGDENPEDPESAYFASYDCSKLFVDDSDHPFFADRLFANRFINRVDALKRGAQQNKIYIFKGPPGCGKSTFLNNLLLKFEDYANTQEGSRFETVWRLDKKLFRKKGMTTEESVINRLLNLINNKPAVSDDFNQHSSEENGAFYNGGDNNAFLTGQLNQVLNERNSPFYDENYIEIPCPSHDHPILMIPKNYRRELFDDILTNDEFKYKLFTDKEYEWVFKESPCTICASIYEALLFKLKEPAEVFKMVFARPYRFNRRLSEGISVFNPGDKPMPKNILSNAMLQQRINDFLRDSNKVKYLFSPFAKTNNGIYALMDIKSYNTERLIDLHNIISDGVHKVEDIEEHVNSLFIALMNPEDTKNIQDIQSFSDRIEYINIPYVLDVNTEVMIYRSIFGKHIDESFLPRVLSNFARVIVASRLKNESEALLEWIGKPGKYSLYCDENLHLLKMEIYSGILPGWLTEEDRKNFNAAQRRRIITESLLEGEKGFSGRDSIKLFNEFYSTYAKEDTLIDMSNICRFFTKEMEKLPGFIPAGFLDALRHMYNYSVLQEVKESLYFYNEEQIARDIMNYLFAVNFEIGTVETCTYSGDKLEITEGFLESVERRLFKTVVDEAARKAFRKDIQKEYTSQTLTQEIMMEGKNIKDTVLYKTMNERYVYNLKEKALDPFLENENFRRAIKDFGEESFKTYDIRVRHDVTYLMDNLIGKYQYTKQGAKEMCIYVIDNDLAAKF